MCWSILAHLLRRCTRLLMVLPSRQQSACVAACDGTALTLLNLGCTRHSSSQLGSTLICTRCQAAFVVCYLYRGRCPRLLKVVPSRHRSACGVLVIWISILTGHDATSRTLLSILIGQMLHMLLCCLEGSTMSNLVHRRRKCAR